MDVVFFYVFNIVCLCCIILCVCVCVFVFGGGVVCGWVRDKSSAFKSVEGLGV